MTLRTFLALPMPEAARTALEPVLEALPVGRVTDVDDLHLTLAFLGEQPDDRLEAAHEAFQALTAPAFDLQPKGLGTFGGATPATVWAGVADPAPVAALAKRVRSALHGAGLPLERRRFRPHVTLARLGRLDAEDEARLARFMGRWSSFPAPVVAIEEMVLFRSILRPDGAVHEPLASYPLRR